MTQALSPVVITQTLGKHLITLGLSFLNSKKREWGRTLVSNYLCPFQLCASTGNIGLWVKGIKESRGKKKSGAVKGEASISGLLKSVGTTTKKEPLSTVRRCWNCLRVCWRGSDLPVTQHLERNIKEVEIAWEVGDWIDSKYEIRRHRTQFVLHYSLSQCSPVKLFLFLKHPYP